LITHLACNLTGKLYPFIVEYVLSQYNTQGSAWSTVSFAALLSPRESSLLGGAMQKGESGQTCYFVLFCFVFVLFVFELDDSPFSYSDCD